MQAATERAERAERDERGGRAFKAVFAWSIIVGLCLVDCVFDYFAFKRNPRLTVLYYVKIVVTTTIGSIISFFVKPVRWARHWPHVIVIATLASILWAPLRWTGAAAAYADRTRKRFGLNKIQAIVFLPAITAASLWAAHRVFPSAFSFVPGIVVPLTEMIWEAGFPLYALLKLIYRSLWERVFADSVLFWQQLIPLYTAWWVGDWIYWIYTDYDLFLSLGRGGSAPTFYGWGLARFRAWLANVDPLEYPRIDPNADPYRGRLGYLPARDGQRPTIKGVTPHRQVDQRVAPGTALALERMMTEVVNNQFEGSAFCPSNDNPLIEIFPSYLEPGLPAVRRILNSDSNPPGTPIQVNTADHGPLDTVLSYNGPNEFGGEIYHPYHDGTSHVALHPEDIAVVIERGWGQRHPFATKGWLWSFYFHRICRRRLPVPEGLVILYPPRTEDEMDVIREIVKAGIWYETKGRLFPLTIDSEPLPPRRLR